MGPTSLEHFHLKLVSFFETKSVSLSFCQCLLFDSADVCMSDWVGSSVARLGDFVKFLPSKFPYKSVPNIWWLYELLKNTSLLSKQCCVYFWAFLETFWPLFYSNIWSHWWEGFLLSFSSSFTKIRMAKMCRDLSPTFSSRWILCSKVRKEKTGQKLPRRFCRPMTLQRPLSMLGSMNEWKNSKRKKNVIWAGALVQWLWVTTHVQKVMGLNPWAEYWWDIFHIDLL